MTLFGVSCGLRALSACAVPRLAESVVSCALL